MSLVRMGVPEELAEVILSNFKPEFFVETGTYKGDTAVWASERFKKVFTVEASEPIFQQTRTRLERISNVECFLGSSVDVLPQILPRLTGPTVFWLDSHYMGEQTYGQVDQCPLLEEIKILNSFTHPQFL